MVAAQSHGLQGLSTPSVAHALAASLGATRDTGSQAEPRLSESESAVLPDPLVICVHFKVSEALD